MSTEPTIRVLSCGAGVQSTAIALLMRDGRLPLVDHVIFADTGWEPARVYAQVDRLAALFAELGIPLHRVQQGNLREDTINPQHRFASIPWFVLAPEHDVDIPVRSDTCPDCAGRPVRDGETCELCDGQGDVPVEWGARPATRDEREGMGRRQCTSEYKLAPITRKIRELLGARSPDYRRVPSGRVAEQWIGFSTDEIHRMSPSRVSYLRNRHPLLELGMSRRDCARYLERAGWGDTAKSACIGCPYHGNRQWREMRDQRPDEWADAVEFDRAIRRGGARGVPLDGQAFLHRSRVPLDIAPIDHVTHAEVRDRTAEAQGDLFDLLEEGDADGCSPYGCRSGEAIA